MVRGGNQGVGKGIIVAIDLTNAVLTFADDFNSFSWNSNGATAWNPNRTANGTWTTHYYWGGGDRALYNNRELQYYADPSTAIVQAYPQVNPFSVADGVLTITARPSPDPALSNSQPYISGLITTENTFSQTYGYFEIKAQLPAGKGLWSAFWMMNQAHTWPPELDILEVLGNNPRELWNVSHTGWGGDNADVFTTDIGVDMSKGFHTYGAAITPDKVRFYFDGREIASADTPQDMKTPMYMLANLALGGWPGTPDATTPFPAEMKIDHIKAWQLPGAAGQTRHTIGSGPDALVLKISQDTWDGDAQYTISVDGRQIGGTMTATAWHDTRTSDTVTVLGDWATGPHAVAITFLNDGYGGVPTKDRNLYLDGATYNDTVLAGSTLSFTSSGTKTLGFTDGSGPTAAGTVTTVGTGPDTLVLKVSEEAYLGHAQFTVKVDGVQIGGTLTATAPYGSGVSDTVNIRGDWAAGGHTLTVTFLNDAWGGTASTDRNLHVDSLSFNSVAVSGGSAALNSTGPRDFSFVEPAGASAPATTTIGSGPDALALSITQDAWQGSAQYTISVDGVQIGGTLSASALRGSGASDSVTVLGDWAAGAHRVTVNFLNDAWGGTPTTDRNLYVEAIQYNDVPVPGGTAALNSGGPKGFDFTDTGSGAAADITLGSGADALIVEISQDSWQGDAQYRVRVDGVLMGGTLTAEAQHGGGVSDRLTLRGDWAPGSHTLSVEFLNDAWGGTAGTDRNLYVDRISFDDAAVAGGALAVSGGTAALMSAGTRDFLFS